jgi:hypothetical protein
VTPAVSRRMARSILRSLRETIGEAAYESVMRVAPESVTQPKGDWVALADWQPLAGEFERRFGDPATWQLLRQATRLAMAVAISKGWSTFLADVTPDLLLERADTFWKMSYNAGTLVVVSRKSRHVVLAIDGWPSPPEPVGAMVAEACAVFLARLGERAPRGIDRVSGDRVEIDVTW